MLAFWISAAGLSAAAGALVLRSAAKSRLVVAPERDAQRRQLLEIERLAGQGLLDEAERQGARTEAARRLLASADHVEAWPSEGAGPRRIALLTAALAPIAALATYVAIGSPGMPDQPYAGRVAEWRATDPATLDPPRIAAVLASIAAERPTDPEPLKHLALARAASGDLPGAEQALRRAVRLAPGRVDLWTALGEVFVSEAQGEVGPDARLAFGEALKIDPAAPSPRYYLARSRIADGDVAGGLADWRALAADLPSDDQGREPLMREIATVEKAGGLPAPVAQPGETEQVQGMIAGMVEGLATRLKTAPDDPDGWVRLVRAYAVMGETAKLAAALAEASARFSGEPKVLAALRQAAQTPPQPKTGQQDGARP
ncbi:MULTISPECIES: c-type cytochrome biogenesis protein CcmI [unclassified Caulobacter]|uniref:c-type cytochrome biogenesis protein CcmI n=1 Tax=unclassified Caulobacter TaxID=2648921 RepID=UPI000D3B152E|nr:MULTISPECIES: c-type cytochrome biogenesis protein CcmI [unclassified Caulobacter]PTS87457.1 c-type cytochrome biogenesis protein CcmI [Caulobacter sp. HMWF009]PTT05001.1 c-type cytochrome biogenesis protein CcmI [Caulobacter sp. HMWF025]